MGTVEQITRVDSFQTHPDQYKHWSLGIDGAVATLTLDVKEENGLRSDYELKQNSYDLGVDIELNDAVERLRFEHPEVRTLVFTSAQPKVFCAGANIKMLASSTHAFKVNFCRYTNETRCGLEDASAHSGLHTIAACNGTAAGGGYELALACDEILLIDDKSSAVSLPEAPDDAPTTPTVTHAPPRPLPPSGDRVFRAELPRDGVDCMPFVHLRSVDGGPWVTKAMDGDDRRWEVRVAHHELAAFPGGAEYWIRCGSPEKPAVAAWRSAKNPARLPL